SVRRVVGVGNRDLANPKSGQRGESLQLTILRAKLQLRAVGQPEHKFSSRIIDHTPRLCLARLLQFLRVTFVRGQKRVKRRAVLDLSEEVSRRPQRNAGANTCLLFESRRQLLHGRAQIGGGSYIKNNLSFGRVQPGDDTQGDG